MVHEPDPEMLCQYQRIDRTSEAEAEIVHCEEGPKGLQKLADYRVLINSGKKYLVEGGDADEPKDWKPQTDVSYYCRKHFDEVIRYSKQPTPPLTFRKIKR